MLPDAGDLVWVDFNPVEGSEQTGRRPALVLSPRAYHAVSRRTIVCPVTSNERPWAFNVPLPRHLQVRGAVLVDQIRAIDREARMFDFIETVPGEVLAEVRAKLAALLDIETAGV